MAWVYAVNGANSSGIWRDLSGFGLIPLKKSDILI